MRTAIFSAKCENLDSMREFVCQAAQDAGMDNQECYAVKLAVDEACSNIIEHAYTGKEGEEIEITCDAADDRLTVIVHDHGRPFDPALIPYPDLTAELKDRPVGGLGIYLMRELMDEVHFEKLGEAGNVLTLVKRRKGAK
jgi:anti-sigma regulatory factor (Ser/Thr protein kinase)